MEKKLAMKWVKALRSGKYKQANDFLVTLDDDEKAVGFCCLGVLAKITGYEIEDMAEDVVLDPDKYKKCGLENDTGLPVNKDEGRLKIEINDQYYDSLAAANDEGVSFKAIATWIEKNYKSL